MKKNIWIWNHYATDMYTDQGGRHYWFAENLRKKGYNVTIFCASTIHSSNDYIDTNGDIYTIKTSGNIPFVVVNTPSYSGNGNDRIINMIVFYKNIFPAAKKYASENGRPDIIIASSVHPLTLVAGIKVSEKFGIPCICEIRDLWPEAIFTFNKAREESLLGKVLLSGEHWIYKKADALIFTKEGDTDYLREKKWDTFQGGDINLKKAYYINNGVDIDTFNKLVKESIVDDEDLNSDKFNVVYVGAIRPINNVGNILDTASLLKNEENIQFLIYGDGNEKEILEKRVVDEGLYNVKMKGFVNKKLIPYILSKSSVNILNYSHAHYNWARGNSSNKLFEYMASGKPIISTIRMGYSIIEKYKCGLELENSTAQELANTILEIKNMPLEKYELLGKNGKKGAEDFDFKVLTEKLIDVINTVN